MKKCKKVSSLMTQKINFPALLILLTTIMLLLFACEAEKPKTYVVGIINPSSGLADVVRGFKEGMEKQGYHEGDNIRYIDDGPLGGIEPVDDRIQAMLAADADLIYSLTTPATIKLKHALEGTNTPGVFGPVFDPVSSGIVDSLGNPGGQLTGVKIRGSAAKAMEWFVAVMPDVKRIFIPFHSTDTAACQTVEDLEDITSKFGIEMITAPVTTPEELKKVLTKIPDDADALWMTCSFMLMQHMDSIVKAASDKNIPTASSAHTRKESKVMLSYGENDVSLGSHISRLAVKILEGLPPESIPVETAEYILGINLKSARSFGIEIPDSVLRQADFIVR